MNLPKVAAFAAVIVAIGLASPIAGLAEQKAAQSEMRTPWKKTHRVVIQVTQNDPAVMTMALNNAENLVNYYKDKGEKIEVEFVAYGAGLTMLRSDTSPVKERLASMAASMKNVTFSGCGNTLEKQAKLENKNITLVSEAHIVPAGIARIVDLEEQGWTYVRP